VIKTEQRNKYLSSEILNP